MSRTLLVVAPGKYAACREKAEAKLAAVGIAGRITATIDTIAALVGGMRFEDNGDGTVTDHQTGLQWEKKTTAFGSGTDFADAHDVDNYYTWTASPYPPNGTDFLVKLNGGSTDGVTLTGCFAGHCDWRLPTIVELQTILLAAFPCGTNPCIDPVSGPTAASYYWSSTTYATYLNLAWNVDFYDGGVDFGDRSYTFYVRAVRIAGSTKGLFY